MYWAGGRPMPTADGLISSLHGAKIFPKIDLNAGCHQLSLAEGSSHLAAFSAHRGLRRCTRLNFGADSAAEQFQQAIQQMLSGIPGVMNISDDMVVLVLIKLLAVRRCNGVLPDQKKMVLPWTERSVNSTGTDLAFVV